MTLDLYGHLFEYRLGEVADRIDAAARADTAVARMLPETRIVRFPAAQTARLRRYNPANAGLPAVPPAGIAKDGNARNARQPTGKLIIEARCLLPASENAFVTSP